MPASAKHQNSPQLLCGALDGTCTIVRKVSEIETIRKRFSPDPKIKVKTGFYLPGYGPRVLFLTLLPRGSAAVLWSLLLALPGTQPLAAF